MTDTTIEQRLADLRVTGDAAARSRAADAAASLTGTGGGRGTVRRPRLAFAAIAIAVVAVLVAATPQGRSVASAAADLVGIGDEPSEQFGFSPNDSTKEDSNVIAVGETPTGIPFELAATTNYVRGEEANGTTCVYMSYPTLDASGNAASCLTAAALQGVYRSHLDPHAQIGPAELGSESDFLVTGTTTPDVASVVITYADEAGEEHSVDATTASLVAGNSNRPNLPGAGPDGQQVRSFVGFLPSTILGELHEDPAPESTFEAEFGHDPDLARIRQVLDGVVVTAYDADGTAIAEQSLGDIPNLDFSIAFGMREQDRRERLDP